MENNLKQLPERFSVYAKTIEEEIYKLNHYTNLQPLCSHVNRYIKKDKHE